MSYLSRQLLDRAGEPAPNWRWRVLMPDLLGSGIDMIKEPILVNEVSLPFNIVEQMQKFRGGTYYGFAGKSNVTSASINFYESSDYRTTSYLEFWRTLVYDVNSGIYRPTRSNKFPITVMMFNTANSSDPMMQVTLEGCWPMGMDPLQLGYSASGQLTVSCGFSVDQSSVDFTRYGAYKPISMMSR